MSTLVRMAASQTGERTSAELQRAAAFRTELRRFLRRTDEVTAQAGLTSQRYDLLLMLCAAESKAEGVRVTDLCDLLHLPQTAVTELVKRADEAGLLERIHVGQRRPGVTAARVAGGRTPLARGIRETARRPRLAGAGAREARGLGGRRRAHVACGASSQYSPRSRSSSRARATTNEPTSLERCPRNGV